MDVTGITWSLPDVEESHQVYVLTVEVTNNFDWRSDVLHDDWLSGKDLCSLIGKLNDMLSLARELLTWLNILAFLGLEKRLQEHLAQSIIWVLIDLCVVLLLGVQLLGLLSKLVDRNLSDNE